MNELYKSVWAQVFAITYSNPLPPHMPELAREAYAGTRADSAAAAALKMWTHARCDEAVAAKGQEP
jgi:hypothetical protein